MASRLVALVELMELIWVLHISLLSFVVTSVLNTVDCDFLLWHCVWLVESAPLCRSSRVSAKRSNSSTWDMEFCHFSNEFFELFVHNIFGTFCMSYVDDLVQDCGISIALAMEIPKSCAEPSIWYLYKFCWKAFGGYVNISIIKVNNQTSNIQYTLNSHLNSTEIDKHLLLI